MFIKIFIFPLNVIMASYYDSFILTVKKIYKRKFYRLSIPFFTVVIGGSFYLKQFTEIRYKYSNTKSLTREEAEKHGIVMKPREEVTLEKQYEEIKEIDITNWDNKRIPRPWEGEENKIG